MCDWARLVWWSRLMAVVSMCMFTDEVEQARWHWARRSEERLQCRLKIYGASSARPPVELVLDYHPPAVHDCCLCPHQTYFILNLLFHFFSCHWSTYVTRYKSHFLLLLLLFLNSFSSCLVLWSFIKVQAEWKHFFYYCVQSTLF